MPPRQWVSQRAARLSGVLSAGQSGGRGGGLSVEPPSSERDPPRLGSGSPPAPPGPPRSLVRKDPNWDPAGRTPPKSHVTCLLNILRARASARCGASAQPHSGQAGLPRLHWAPAAGPRRPPRWRHHPGAPTRSALVREKKEGGTWELTTHTQFAGLHSTRRSSANPHLDCPW